MAKYLLKVWKSLPTGFFEQSNFSTESDSEAFSSFCAAVQDRETVSARLTCDVRGMWRLKVGEYVNPAFPDAIRAAEITARF